jgi:tetratricopeptide (TPR) repeat protein
MADHRKAFRPARAAFGAALTLLGAAGLAEAQDAGLKNGAAAITAGNYDNAVRLLSTTVNSDSASSSDAAKALYLRGVAYRKLGQPSRAIADLGAAMWLGLPGSERVRAQVNRGLAYRSAGLTKEADADFAVARNASSSSEVEKIIAQDGAGAPAAIAAFATEVRPEEQAAVSPRTVRESPAPRTASAAPEASGDWDTSVSSDTATEQRSGNRVSRWLGFGSSGGSSSAPAPAPAPAAEPAPVAAPTRTAAAPAAAPPPPRATQASAPSTWTTTTEVPETAAASSGSSQSGTRIGRWFARTTGPDSPEPAAAPASAPTASAASGGGGSYRLQLANSRSEAEAKALWQKAARANQQLASAQPQIEKVDIGNFGTFYSLKVGSFADRAESQKLCNALKRSDIDCSVVTPGGP